jgi:hypothetical protein
MKYTNLLLAIPKSFYSATFYREVAESWHGRSFLYLLILLFICWLVIAGVFASKANHGMRFMAKQATQLQLPIIHFDKGMASTKPAKVFEIKDPDSNKIFLIIDTENKIQDFQKSDALVLIQKHAIFIKQQQTPEKITQYYYPKELTYKLGPSQIQWFFKTLSAWVMPIIFIVLLGFGLLFSYAYRIIQILIYALIGMIFNAILGRKLPYESLMSLSIICITPAIILSTIFAIFFIYFPYEWLFYFLLSMVYLFFAIKATPKNQPETTTDI